MSDFFHFLNQTQLFGEQKAVSHEVLHIVY